MKAPKLVELKLEAKALGIKGYYKMKKNELIIALEKFYKLEDPKKFYKIKLTSNHSTLEIPITHTSELRDAIGEFKKTKFSNLFQGYSQIELFENNKLIRREKR